jgi:hypothetical protein
MGCDIHLYKEKFVDGAWISADVWADEYGDGLEVPFEERFTDRNYNLFGLLACGVRREFEFSFAPRGLPFNVCKLVADSSNGWGIDGHGHSYLFLHELKEMKKFLQTEEIEISGMKQKDELAALRSSIEGPGKTDWDLLYPYCQGTNAHDYEEFSIRVPAEFIVGSGLEKIIAGFDGCDGENHRIVFWFDN